MEGKPAAQIFRISAKFLESERAILSDEDVHTEIDSLIVD